MSPQMDPRLRKRILLFYFAAAINLIMALWVLSAGSGRMAAATLTVIMVIFLVFAALNYYMARSMQKQWDAHVRQQRLNAEEANEKRSSGA